MRTVKLLLILLLFSVTALAQQSGEQGGSESGNSGGGNSTKIWEPDLVELWIYWHKQQYSMFEEFNHNEDTLNTVQNEELRNYMSELRKVDEILFKQYQDNDKPKPVFMNPEAAYALELTIDLLAINKNAFDMINKAPVDGEILLHYIEANVKTYKEFSDLIDATVKYLKGWDRTNLRDNNVRDNLSDFIIKKLETIVGDWNMLYKRWETSKYERTFKTINQSGL
jgi:hypothetical protein